MNSSDTERIVPSELLQVHGYIRCVCGSSVPCHPSEEGNSNGSHTSVCGGCGRTWKTSWHTEDVTPPARMKRWCVRDTRDCEPYEGWKIWETEMERCTETWADVTVHERWRIFPNYHYGGRFDWSFETRDEAYAAVLKCLREELAEKQQELENMQREAEAAR